MGVGLSDFEDTLVGPSRYSFLSRVSLELIEGSSIEQQLRDKLLEVLVQVFASSLDAFKFCCD
jgi:hypothetical protein